jgi:hypothetical protein
LPDGFYERDALASAEHPAALLPGLPSASERAGARMWAN